MINVKVKLGDLCHVVTKGTTPTSLGFEFLPEGIPFLRIQNLRDRTVTLEGVLHIDEMAHKALKRSLVKPNDFLITIAGTIGRAAIVPDYFPECNCNQAIAILRFDDEKLWPKYLLYWLSTNDASDQISGKKVTATISNLSLGQIKELEIPLPPLAEQKRISAILDKADAIHRKRRQAIQLADDFLRSVFLNMFGDPVANPKGWSIRPLSSGIESITSGWSANGESYPCENDELGVLKISSVTSGRFIPEENKFVHREDIPQGKILVFPKKGDLLFSRANTRELVAATCVVQQDQSNVFLPDKIWKIQTDNDTLLPEFLNYLISEPRFKEKLTSQATGTSGSMLNISKAKFEATNAIFPDYLLQSKFRAIFWKTQGMIDNLKCSLEGSERTFSSLSQRAFSGQL